MNRHQIPAGMLASLADPDSGPGIVAHLAAAEYSKHLLLLRGVVSAARDAGHPERSHARDAYDLLAAVQEQAPEAADALLRYPSVGAWARRVLLGMDEREPDERELGEGGPGFAVRPASLAAIAGAAAIRAGYPCSVEVPVTGGVVNLPSLGRVVLGARGPRDGWAVLRSATDGAEVAAGRSRVRVPAARQHDADGWLGLRDITAGPGKAMLRLIIDDLDPDRMREVSLGHRLTGEQVIQWQACLRDAWGILRRHHPVKAAEAMEAFRVLVPIQPPGRGTRSATSRDNFGCVGVSMPVGPVSLALAVAHEVQHAKLWALQNFIPLTRPDDGRRYYAPWREDPRPANGLLQGAYAHLGVASFWRRQRFQEEGASAMRAHAEYARWRTAVLAVVRRLLDSGTLTATGQELVARMADMAASWGGDAVPADAMDLAGRAASRHAAQWNSRYGTGGEV